MKIIYKGHKPRMTISFPPGGKLKSQMIETISFIQGDPVEVRDDWAVALMRIDGNFIEGTDVKTKKIKLDKNFASTIEKRLEVGG